MHIWRTGRTAHFKTSNVGTDLNNLAAMLAATNRLDDAESLMRLMVDVFLRSGSLHMSRTSFSSHIWFQTAGRAFAWGCGSSIPTNSGVIADGRLYPELFPQIARQNQERPTVRSQPAQSGYCTAFTFLLGKSEGVKIIISERPALPLTISTPCSHFASPYLSYSRILRVSVFAPDHLVTQRLPRQSWAESRWILPTARLVQE